MGRGARRWILLRALVKLQVQLQLHTRDRYGDPSAHYRTVYTVNKYFKYGIEGFWEPMLITSLGGRINTRKQVYATQDLPYLTLLPLLAIVARAGASNSSYSTR